MMNLKSLTNIDLISQAKIAVNNERELTAQILHYLREIEKRRLFAEKGFSSLHEFTVRELGYSDAAAHRRISAMRLLKELPEIEPAIKAGTLSLSTISQVQSFLRAESKLEGKSYTPTQKKELLNTVAGKSTREVEKLFATISPQSIRRDRERQVTETETEIRFTASDRLMTKLKKIKALSSHKNSNSGYAELIEMLADMAIEKLDPERKQQRMEKRKQAKQVSIQVPAQIKLSSAKENPFPAPKMKRAIFPSKSSAVMPSRYIPQSEKRQVWIRDGGQCAYKDPKTGNRCQSKHLLQFDHIQPVALGGNSTAKNLRLFCSTHNQWQAIQSFGKGHMERFINF